LKCTHGNHSRNGKEFSESIFSPENLRIDRIGASHVIGIGPISASHVIGIGPISAPHDVGIGPISAPHDVGVGPIRLAHHVRRFVRHCIL
jgi:hypothetical protein